MSMETVFHVVKDAMAALEQSINVLLANLDTSLLELNVKLHVNLTISEMDPMDAENVLILVNHAHPPLPVLHALKQETNQLTEFVTLVFIHAPTVLHMNNVLDV